MSPSTATLFATQSATFTSTVTGTTNTAVNWSVQEGTSGGSITTGGVYTAPSSTGVFHVIATSQADTSKSAAAAVTVNPAPPPAFTSTPPTSASEGQTYTYTLAATDPANGSVSFALTSGPTNATLNGNVLTWMPSHAQSRVSNGFSITATTSAHVSATQNFAVIPTGNINGIIDVVAYTATGKTIVPVDYMKTAQAFVPDGKGSYTTVQGSLSSGSFTIPGVPQGYFMLYVGDGRWNNQLLWTSASDVDFSVPYQGRLDTSYTNSVTTLNVAFSVPKAGSPQGCILTVPNLGYPTYIFETWGIFCNAQWRWSYEWLFPTVDPAKNDQTYVYAELPVPNLLNDTWTGFSIADYAGPFDLAISDGATVDFSGSMTAQASNASVRANLGVAQLVSLSSGISPKFTGSAVDGPTFLVGVQPYTAEYYLQTYLAPVNFDTNLFQIAPLLLYPYSTNFNTDADLGDVPYANPFPSTWAQYAALRLSGELQYFADNATSGIPLRAGIGTITLNMPTAGSPIEPLAGPATSIKINGNDFFQDQSIPGVQPVVSWSAPSVGTPDGYSLSIIQLKTAGIGTRVGTVFTIYTTQNSITVPPGLLQTGYAYAFQLQAFKGNPKVETAPRFSSFPWGYADAFSGTVHVVPN